MSLRQFRYLCMFWMTQMPGQGSEMPYSFRKKALFFTCLQYTSFENTVGKGEIARNEQFLLFPQCFLPLWRALSHFHPN